MSTIPKCEKKIHNLRTENALLKVELERKQEKVEKYVALSVERYKELMEMRGHFTILINLIKTTETPEQLQKLKDLPNFK